MKRRSDIAKLVSHCREVWRQSVNYQTAKKQVRSTFKTGWFTCPKCTQDREVVQIDHDTPIGEQPKCFLDFGPWLEKLFNSPQHGMCKDCHKAKTKEENRLRRAQKNEKEN